MSITADDIRAWPMRNGWHICPGVPGCERGNRVSLGDGVMIGDGVTLGNRVRLGDGVKLGDGVTIGDGVKLGDDVTLGYEVTRVIALGYDARGYALVVALQHGKPRFGAGCRWFTFDEAREHWGPNYTGDGDVEYFRIMIDAAERIAATWANEAE